MAYVSGKDSAPPPDAELLHLSPEADPGCFLCRDSAAEPSKENLVVRQGDRSLVVLNRYPYNNGHLLISPRRHVADLGGLSREEQAEIHEMLVQMTGSLESILHCDGFNVGLNLGQAAGAGVPGHLHWHLVPRWTGDHNFMPTTAGARVISQSLESLWELLTEKPRQRE
jgi:ATP adenylyltransferase